MRNFVISVSSHWLPFCYRCYLSRASVVVRTAANVDLCR